MENRVFYQPSTGWITIHILDYHTWQVTDTKENVTM